MGDKEEAACIYSPTLERSAQVLTGVLSSSMVAPKVTADTVNDTGWPVLSVQKSVPGSSGWIGGMANVLWLGLTCIGAAALFLVSELKNARIVIGAVIGGQIALHLVYGGETFLYSLHFLPLLVIVGAFGTRTRWRTVSLTIAGLLVPLLLLNNFGQFGAALHLLGRVQ